MLAVSTSWNAARNAGWAPAAAELLALGHLRVALDGPALQGDAARAGRIVREAHGEVVALFAPAPPPGESGRPEARGIAAPRPEERQVAVAAATAAGAAARAAGVGVVVLRPGDLPELDAGRERRWLDRLARDAGGPELRAEVAESVDRARSDRVRFLEALCRSLHQLARADPDLLWLIETPSRTTGIPRPEEAELVFDDLPGRRVGWWHDTAHAARLAALGAVAPEEWLARLGPRTHGLTVSDWGPMGDRLPPGAGVVDWPALRLQATGAMRRVLALDAAFPAQLLADAVREARALGLE